MSRCCTCGRDVTAPYRSRDRDGHIVQGCIDESHTGHLYGESKRWHDRPTARAWRRRIAVHLTEIVGEPMRGFGLPGRRAR